LWSERKFNKVWIISIPCERSYHRVPWWT
jgi:hypothetical protein